MGDRITANLPARSFDETAAFYSALGFEVAFRDEGWMILRRGDLEVEFFPHPELDPAVSWFSACVRVGDADRLFAEWNGAGLPASGIPRITAPADDAHGLRMFALVDPNEACCAAWRSARRQASTAQAGARIWIGRSRGGSQM